MRQTEEEVNKTI